MSRALMRLIGADQPLRAPICRFAITFASIAAILAGFGAILFLLKLIFGAP